jgi:hypothetical protein
MQNATSDLRENIEPGSQITAGDILRFWLAKKVRLRVIKYRIVGRYPYMTQSAFWTSCRRFEPTGMSKSALFNTNRDRQSHVALNAYKKVGVEFNFAFK